MCQESSYEKMPVFLLFNNTLTTAVSAMSEIFIPPPSTLAFTSPRINKMKTEGEVLLILFTKVAFSGLLEVFLISC